MTAVAKPRSLTLLVIKILMNEDAKSATDNVLCLAWLGRSERIFFPEGDRGRALFTS